MAKEKFTLPTAKAVRQRIDNIKEKQYRMALKFGWLGLCRVSEIVGQAYPSDVKTTPRGPTGDCAEITLYRGGEKDMPVALFTVSTSKRGGLARTAAYPIDPSYEPWSGELCQYFDEFSDDQHVFDFTRQRLWQEARKAFAGLTYPIEEYRRIIELHELRDGMEIVKERKDDIIVKHAKHNRVMGTHAIRHIRSVDLMNIYGFTVQELSVIGGWSLRSMTGASGAIGRYTHLNWQSYFQKLLIRRF